MRNSSAHFALGDNVVGFTPTVHDFLEQSCTVDTVGEFPKQRAYAFYPTEFKELTRLKLRRVAPGNLTHRLSQNRT